MKNKKSQLSKSMAMTLAVGCSVVLIIGIIFSSRYVFDCASAEKSIHVQEKNTVDYRVHYTDSKFFDPTAERSPQKGQSYLLGYTDYIKITDTYQASFEKAIPVNYTYQAVETLVVHYVKGAGDSENPEVMEKKFSLADIQGSAMTDKLSFLDTADQKSPGGTYLIHLKPFQDIYTGFMAEETSRAHAGGMSPEQKLAFSAELKVDFIYTLKNDENKLDKTITRGISIPISDEVYSISFTGTPTAEYNIPERVIHIPTLPITLLIAAGFILAAIGLIYGLRNFFKDDDSFRAQVNTLLRRYNDDIILASSPVTKLDDYERIQVDKFKELLKISVDQSKPITCYRNLEQGEAVFFILCDSFAYEYKLARD